MCVTWARIEGSGLRGYRATSLRVVACIPWNELEEPCTLQRHILKCTSVKTSKFARIKIFIGERAWYRTVVLCTAVKGWLVPKLQVMQGLLSVCLLTYIWSSVLWNQNLIPVRCGHMILKIAAYVLNLFQKKLVTIPVVILTLNIEALCSSRHLTFCLRRPIWECLITSCFSWGLALFVAKYIFYYWNSCRRTANFAA